MTPTTPPEECTIAAPGAEPWKAERDSMLRVRIMQGDVIANHVIAMQAAIIEAVQVNPKEGLRWIYNTLRGPGFLPDMDEAARLGSAQAWFDAKTAEHEAFRAANPGPAEPESPRMVAVCCGRFECGGECGNEWQGEEPADAQATIDSLRTEVAALKAERDAAFAMSRCECSAEECCANLVKLKAERDAALAKCEAAETQNALLKQWDNYVFTNDTPIREQLDAAIDSARADTGEKE